MIAPARFIYRPMPNATMTRFGYPDTLIHEYNNWVVLLRESQVTLGSLVLCAKSEATAFSELSRNAFHEMESVVGDIEQSLTNLFHYNKINYLMLMMVDPNVHFHVFPRYDTRRSACGLTLEDAGWPALPQLANHHALTPIECVALRDEIKNAWRA